MAPWDAGSHAQPEDPFEAAAQGDWVEEPTDNLEQPGPDAGPSDAGALEAEAQAEPDADASRLDAAPVP